MIKRYDIRPRRKKASSSVSGETETTSPDEKDDELEPVNE
jgi:hypothetical protein